MTPAPPELCRLREAFARYEDALGSGDRWELVSTRLALYRALDATGWTPEPVVRDQMWRDEKTLRLLEEQRASEQSDLVRPPSHRPWDSVPLPDADHDRDPVRGAPGRRAP